MTSSTPTKQQIIALLKHLANGKTVDQVATIINQPAAVVEEYATRHGWPDTDKVEWAIDELTTQAAQQAAALPTRTEPTRIPTQPQPTPAAQGGGVAAPAKPDEIRILLNTAKGHPSKRIQAAADRVFDQLDRLRGMIREDEEKHSEKRKAEAEKAKIRAEVERLEHELAAAKAKLRGKPIATTSPTTAQPRPSTGETYACRHDGCDKTYDTPQGRSLHERMKCEHNPLRQAS